MIKEAEMTVKIFDKPEEYNQYLSDLKLHPFSDSRAMGLRFQGDQREIIIDRSYYREAGLTEKMLQALTVHEQTELEDNSPDAHFHATVAEYRYILDHFGPTELRCYHACLCNAIGGVNDTRVNALNEVLP